MFHSHIVFSMIVSVVDVLRLATSFSLHVMQVSIDVGAAFFYSFTIFVSVSQIVRRRLDTHLEIPLFCFLAGTKGTHRLAGGVITVSREYASDAKDVTR
jgi:hypothetical protein